MKRILYISILLVLVTYSCSKEQNLTPTTKSNITIHEMNKTSDTECAPSGYDDVITIDNNIDNNITDPEKDDKEKSNKKAKN